MIPGPLAALVRCVRRGRRVAPAPLTGLTMQQAAAILAPRPRVVRRAVALGCPAAALPTVAIPPALPGLPPPVPPIMPLPYGIGSGPLLPTAFGAPPWSPPAPIYDTIAQAPAGVPEPGALALLLVALAMLAAALLWRRAA